MKAMILAAGEGTRLRPLTLETPKPLLPIGGVPLLERTLLWLKAHGISEVAINLYHQGEKIKACLGNGSRLGMKLVYSEEKTLLGTAGGVKKMEPFFDGPFVVAYGDNLTDFNLSEMMKLHHDKHSMATIAVFEVARPWEVGIVQMDEKGKVLSLVEKPRPEERKGNLANAGVYVFERKILDYIPAAVFSDFAYEIFPKILAAGVPVYAYRLKPEDYLIDIGTLDKYNQADADAREGRLRVGGQGSLKSEVKGLWTLDS